MSKKTKTFNDVLLTRQVMQTNDYGRFQVLEGNRTLNKNHVNQLIRLMMSNGNLTDQFPIEVDDKGFVIDGQHRLEALKTLGWEVGYIVVDGASIETVRRINQGNRNWNWRDIAESYARLGNPEYLWFLKFYDNHDGLSFTLAMMFSSAKLSKRNAANSTFVRGELVVRDKAQAELFASQYEELSELVDLTGHDFGKACNRIFRSPFYNHDRMVSKMQKLGGTLPVKAAPTDYMREMEAIYNYHMSEENSVRLFN